MYAKDKKQLISAEKLKKNWYVIQTHSLQESKVKEELIIAIQRHNMTEFFGEIIIPTEKIVEIKQGVKRNTIRRFFPGYIIIQMDANPQTIKLVKSLKKVRGFVGSSLETPTPLNESDIQYIESLMQNTDSGKGKIKLKYDFQVGQVVRVKSGPFADFTGVIEDMNYEKGIVHISVYILGRSTPVELDFSQIEKES